MFGMVAATGIRILAGVDFKTNLLQLFPDQGSALTARGSPSSLSEKDSATR